MNWWDSEISNSVAVLSDLKNIYQQNMLQNCIYKDICFKVNNNLINLDYNLINKHKLITLV